MPKKTLTPKSKRRQSANAGGCRRPSFCSPFKLNEITQRLIDPVHGGEVEAVHVEDARLMLKEIHRLASNLTHVIDTLGYAVDKSKSNHLRLINEINSRMRPTENYRSQP